MSEAQCREQLEVVLRETERLGALIKCEFGIPPSLDDSKMPIAERIEQAIQMLNIAQSVFYILDRGANQSD